MTDWFVVTRGLRGPQGSVYHDERPKVSHDRRLTTGELLLHGPVEAPEGWTLDGLLAVYRGTSNRELIRRLRAKAASTSFTAERDALLAKANELEARP